MKTIFRKINEILVPKQSGSGVSDFIRVTYISF